PSHQQSNPNMMMHINNMAFLPQDTFHLQYNTYGIPGQTSSQTAPQASISTNSNEDLIMRKKLEQKRRFQQSKHVDANSLIQAMFEDFKVQKPTNETKKTIPKTEQILEEPKIPPQQESVSHHSMSPQQESVILHNMSPQQENVSQLQNHHSKHRTSQPLPELNDVMLKCSDLRHPVKLLPKQSIADTTISSIHDSHSQTKLFEPSKRAADWSHVTEDINDLFLNLQTYSDVSTVAPASVQTTNSPPLFDNVHSNTFSSFAQPIAPQVQFQYPSWSYNDNLLPVVYHHVYEASFLNNGIQTDLLYPILLLSGLSKEQLSFVWSSVNYQLPGQLIKEELYCALALIGLIQQHMNNVTFEHLYHLQQIPVPYFQLPNAQDEHSLTMENKQDLTNEESKQNTQEPVSIVNLSSPTVDTATIIPIKSIKEESVGFHEFLDEKETSTISCVTDDKYSLFKQDDSVISSCDPYSLFKFSQTPSVFVSDAQLSSSTTDSQIKQVKTDSLTNSFTESHQGTYSLFQPENTSIKYAIESDPYFAFREEQQRQEVIDDIRIEKVEEISWYKSDNEIVDTVNCNFPFHRQGETGDIFANLSRSNVFTNELTKTDSYSLFESNNNPTSLSNISAASISTFLYEPPELITTNSDNEEEDNIQFQHNDDDDEDNYLSSIDEQQPSFLNVNLQYKSSDSQSVASLDLPNNSIIQRIKEDSHSNEVDIISSVANMNDDNRSTSSQISETIKQSKQGINFSPYANHDMTHEDNDDVSPTKVWLSCLQKCGLVLSTANEIFSSIKSSLLCVEILQNSKAIDYVYQLQEIYYLSKRILTSIKYYGLITNELNDISKQIIVTWTNLQAFFSSANLQLPNEESIDYTSSTITNVNSNDYCHICLISLKLDSLYPSTCLNLFNISIITFGDHLYHASCANFYLNMINSSLPSLMLPHFS
ncbi:unnamed protein product, partial [Didymodactylos carnosus]